MVKMLNGSSNLVSCKNTMKRYTSLQKTNDAPNPEAPFIKESSNLFPAQSNENNIPIARQQ
jgi:hypothetical protein